MFRALRARQGVVTWLDDARHDVVRGRRDIGEGGGQTA